MNIININVVVDSQKSVELARKSRGYLMQERFESILKANHPTK